MIIENEMKFINIWHPYIRRQLVAVADSDSDMVKPPIGSYYEPVTTKGLDRLLSNFSI